jgi:D-lyxose ketol-isomerase
MTRLIAAAALPVRTAWRLAELVHGSELTLVPNVKHMTFWEGDGALSALGNFLQRHPMQ